MYSDWATVTPGCLFNSIPFEGGWGGGGQNRDGRLRGGLSNLEQLVRKDLEYKMEKLKYKKV